MSHAGDSYALPRLILCTGHRMKGERGRYPAALIERRREPDHPAPRKGATTHRYTRSKPSECTALRGPRFITIVALVSPWYGKESQGRRPLPFHLPGGRQPPSWQTVPTSKSATAALPAGGRSGVGHLPSQVLLGRTSATGGQVPTSSSRR
jgi:hypothetical protein